MFLMVLTPLLEMVVGDAGASLTFSFYPSERPIYGKEVGLNVGDPGLGFRMVCDKRAEHGCAEVGKQ